MKMNVIELFGGIGACTKALKNLGVKVNIIDYVEIDKYACKSYNAINNTNFEPQDIMKWDKHFENIDLITHGSPCQDFSLAGKQQGGDEGSGTRSSLMYETLRIVRDIKPKYVLWENVKNLLSKKHRHNFDNYLNYMNDLGYTNYYQVLNAKDYGIPQNRERVFTISIRNDIDKKFIFPPKEELKLKLKDMLEDEVDEKYYLSGKQIERITTTNYNAEKTRIQEKEYCDTLLARDWKDPKCVEVNRKYGVFDTDKTTHQAGSVYDKNGLCPTLDTMQGGWRQPCIEIKNATKKGYLEAEEGDGVNISSRMKYQRGNAQKEMSQTLDTQATKGVVVREKISQNQVLLKEKLCDELIEQGIVKEMDVINHSYTNAREKEISDDKNVILSNNESPTLTTRSDCLGVTVRTIGNYSPSNHNPLLSTNESQKEITLKSKDKRLRNLVNNTKLEEGKVMNLDLYNQTTNENISQCLTEPNHNSQRLFDGLRIRKLTPKECWRLMGFDDSDFEKAEKENSNTQLYKQAGNSIVVNVLEKIFLNLL